MKNIGQQRSNIFKGTMVLQCFQIKHWNIEKQDYCSEDDRSVLISKI